MVKRSLPSTSPEPQSEPEQPPTKQQKPRPSPKTKAKAKAESTSTTPAASPAKRGLTNDEKIYLMAATMDLASRTLPFNDLARDLGIPEGRIKDQFKANRANLRKAVEDLFRPSK